MRAILVVNLPEGTSLVQIQDVFKKFGEIEKNFLTEHPVIGKICGHVFIKFKGMLAVDKALMMNTRRFADKPLRIFNPKLLP